MRKVLGDTGSNECARRGQTKVRRTSPTCKTFVTRVKARLPWSSKSMVQFYDFLMMDKEKYAAQRSASSALFKNSLVLPVAVIAADLVAIDATVTIPEIREGLEGRAADNAIEKSLKRLSEVGALTHIPSPGQPHPHFWIRRSHPLWNFVEEWTLALDSAPGPTAAR